MTHFRGDKQMLFVIAALATAAIITYMLAGWLVIEG